MFLKETFTSLVLKYTPDTHKYNKLWQEIEEQYTSNGRHYHTLKHLENLLEVLTEVKDQMEDWDAVLFALYYHDLIYLATSDKNEEDSADMAESRLTELEVPHDKIEICTENILATKSHTISKNNDTNLFTDVDLSILGQPWEQYCIYKEEVRQEYIMYPNEIYNPGRKKVLNHFLSMERIYKTEYFHHKLERHAKMNIHNELNSL
ncbi:MAG: hypothetical protein HYZ42_06475 [Bacteroidetes bacterium]|nr:hypothetical protein [Bacteroidota bacterium]